MIKTFNLTKATIPVTASFSTYENDKWVNHKQGTSLEFNRLYAFRDYLLALAVENKETEAK